MTLSREEQETHFNQTAQERIDDIVHVYTDDPVTIRKMEKDGWTGKPLGEGMVYLCEGAYINIRKRKVMDLTDEERQEIAIRLQGARD